MRRKEKAVRDAVAIKAILLDAPFLTLAIPDGDALAEPYLVPLSFGISGKWEDPEDPLHLWIHSAKAGRKWELLTRLSGRDITLPFSAVADLRLKDGGEKGCSYSAYFRSVIGSVAFEIVEEPETKRQGFKAIMAHYKPERCFTFPEEMLATTGVILLRVTKIGGKQNPPEAD